VVTRYGKPIAVVTPVVEKSSAELLLSMRQVLDEAGISKKEALKALEEVREEIYA